MVAMAAVVVMSGVGIMTGGPVMTGVVLTHGAGVDPTVPVMTLVHRVIVPVALRGATALVTVATGVLDAARLGGLPAIAVMLVMRATHSPGPFHTGEYPLGVPTA